MLFRSKIKWRALHRRFESHKYPKTSLSDPIGRFETHFAHPHLTRMCSRSAANEGDYKDDDDGSADRPDAIGANARTPEIDQKFVRHDTALHLKNMKSESFCQGAF